jgi:16S rRNA (uracil1498-N3)-methyltransferase
VPGQSVFLEKDEAAHLFKVLRRRKDAPVRFINGQGCRGTGRLAQLEAGAGQLLVETAEQLPAPPPRRLVWCLTKGHEIEDTLPKAVELGMAAVDLVRSDHVVATWHNPEHRLERLRRIVREAGKQSSNPWSPTLTLHQTLDAWFVTRATSMTCFFGDLHERNHTLRHAMASLAPEAPACVLIGPEGDFSERERALLHRHASPVRLTDFVLRSDTAALYAMALMARIPHSP